MHRYSLSRRSDPQTGGPKPATGMAKAGEALPARPPGRSGVRDRMAAGVRPARGRWGLRGIMGARPGDIPPLIHFIEFVRPAAETSRRRGIDPA